MPPAPAATPSPCSPNAPLLWGRAWARAQLPGARPHLTQALREGPTRKTGGDQSWLKGSELKTEDEK